MYIDIFTHRWVKQPSCVTSYQDDVNDDDDDKNDDDDNDNDKNDEDLDD